jgi:hypothetical protein
MSYHLKQLALQQYASTLRKAHEYWYLSIPATLGIPPNDQPFRSSWQKAESGIMAQAGKVK